MITLLSEVIEAFNLTEDQSQLIEEVSKDEITTNEYLNSNYVLHKGFKTTVPFRCLARNAEGVLHGWYIGGSWASYAGVTTVKEWKAKAEDQLRKENDGNKN